MVCCKVTLSTGLSLSCGVGRLELYMDGLLKGYLINCSIVELWSWKTRALHGWSVVRLPYQLFYR